MKQKIVPLRLADQAPRACVYVSDIRQFFLKNVCAFDWDYSLS